MILNICKSSKLLLVTFSILVAIPMAISKYEEEEMDLISESWGFTDVKIAQTKFTWSINHLKFCCQNVGDSLVSPTFSSSDGCKWYLDISPKGDNKEDKDYVALFLFSVNCNSSTTAKFSILNAKGEQTNLKKFSHYLEPGKSWGYKQYMLQSDLLNEANELLPHGMLNITCEFTSHVHTENFLRKFDQPKRHLAEDLGYLFDHQVLTDVTLTSEGEEFEAHKAILAVRSPVFKTILEGRRKDKVVEIKDVDCKTLAEVLRYIYTEKVLNLEKLAPTLLAAADNYELGGLKTLSENNLRSRISAENAIDFLVLGDKYCADELKNEAKRFIVSHASDIANTTGFKSLMMTQPRLAVETFDLID